MVSRPAAGINVITAVNTEHLESIADEVERMTGAPVREHVPDWVVRKADQIELVDSSPSSCAAACCTATSTRRARRPAHGRAAGRPSD